LLSSARRARALSKSKMPPQQPDRLLDLVDDILDFRAHGSPAGVLAASPPAGCSDCARSTQWAPIARHARVACAGKPASPAFGPTASVMNLPPRQARIALRAKPIFLSLP
jgi:hypothetical protein